MTRLDHMERYNAECWHDIQGSCKYAISCSFLLHVEEGWYLMTSHQLLKIERHHNQGQLSPSLHR